jgi:hypothetical protein
MINIERTLVKDFDEIAPRTVFAHEPWCHHKEEMIKHSLCYTLRSPGGEVGCIIGAYRVWPGVYEIFAVTSDVMAKYPIGFHKAVLKLFAHAPKFFRAHRFQATVRANYDQGCKWLEAFGFVAEGLMKGYGPDGADYFIYGRAV